MAGESSLGTIDSWTLRSKICDGAMADDGGCAKARAGEAAAGRTGGEGDEGAGRIVSMMDCVEGMSGASRKASTGLSFFFPRPNSRRLLVFGGGVDVESDGAMMRAVSDSLCECEGEGRGESPVVGVEDMVRPETLVLILVLVLVLLPCFVAMCVWRKSKTLDFASKLQSVRLKEKTPYLHECVLTARLQCWAERHCPSSFL